MKQAVDHIEGGNFRGTPGIGKARQQVRQGKDCAGVFCKLLKLAAGMNQPTRHCRRACLPPDGLIALQTTAFVFAAAPAGTGQIPGRARRDLCANTIAGRFHIPIAQRQLHAQAGAAPKPVTASLPSSSWPLWSLPDASGSAIAHWQQRLPPPRP